MRARIALPSLDQLTQEQAALVDTILRTRPSLDGPFMAWLHVPGFAAPAQALGAYCRYATGLSPRESELLILMTAARFDCDGEWDIHAPIAAASGVSAEDLATTRSGGTPFARDDREAALLAFAAQLLRTNRVLPDTFAQAQAVLDVETLVKVAGLIGYYSLVAMTLNAFDMRADQPFNP